MYRERHESIKIFLSMLAVFLVIATIGHVVSVISYNSKSHTVKGVDPTEKSYIDLEDRVDSTSTWQKRDFDLDGKTVDLIGQTFDGKLINNALDEISSWRMTIRIKNDCFLNNAWCGTVEIHQGVASGAGKVQVIDLRNYKIEDIQLEYLYDGDLLIPLSKDDYIVYYPSAADVEIPVRPQSELTMGMIFYYLDSIDLSDHDFIFTYHKSYFEGLSFYGIVFLAVIWLAVFFALIISSRSYKKALNEMEQRKTGMSYMSNIYDLIYIVDMITNDLIPIKNKTSDLPDHPNNMKALDRLKELFIHEVSDEYRNIVEDYLDPQKLKDRFERGDVICEYEDTADERYLIRLIDMNHENGQPYERFIFTLRNVTAERARILEKQKHMAEEESVHEEIIYEKEEYSFKDLIQQVENDTKDAAQKQSVEFSTDISAGIPEKLVGDPSKIRLALSCMVLSSINFTQSRSIKLSVFCMEKEGACHLLVSVKDTGAGTAPGKDLSGLSISIAEEILKVLGSSLQILREKDTGSELYFELDQEVAGI